MLRKLLPLPTSSTVNPNDQSAIEHLEEMRKRLIRTLIAFLVAMAAAFIYVEEIYHWLVRGMQQQLVLLGPSEVMWVYMIIAGVVAVTVTLPIAAYQVWRFVQPALPEGTDRSATLLISVISVLFVAGICFGYFVLFPMVLQFMQRMAEGEFQTMYTAQKYFTFMIHMTVPFGFLFEMPAIVVFLTKLGIVNPFRLAKLRKSAYFLLCIVAVTITPPDVMSDLIVIVPLFLLYEISVTISRFVYRKQLQAPQAESSV
ncbi:twin-arginine translocase subunit TatC [Paenibacillus sp. JCM 10914]|uniref:twin-arginine translocase subunit TatC n=1 Tax=Paenibacillus sp. JCM 10914 TaxID=1236974 RepID=UPI0003CC5327|nr:twin-arginine translocase subunit TatC [Paenibacillus sp. JCM 10914]GAE06644.1 twin-arginine translocation protein TatC [Paenibacillus sp. JCM 10914]